MILRALYIIRRTTRDFRTRDVTTRVSTIVCIINISHSASISFGNDYLNPLRLRRHIDATPVTRVYQYSAIGLLIVKFVPATVDNDDDDDDSNAVPLIWIRRIYLDFEKEKKKSARWLMNSVFIGHPCITTNRRNGSENNFVICLRFFTSFGKTCAHSLYKRDSHEISRRVSF